MHPLSSVMTAVLCALGVLGGEPLSFHVYSPAKWPWRRLRLANPTCFATLV
jgi:hypothetical protein